MNSEHSKHLDRKQDEAVKESFPASDPPANTGITGAGSIDQRGAAEQATETDRVDEQRDNSDAPTGTPTSDRHAAETAHVSEADDPTSEDR